MPPRKKKADAASKPGEPVKVEAIKHGEAARANIPTREMQGLAAEHEEKPAELLYPRDPSLDPQLVWTGKDADDAQPLKVVAAPVYIQEKIHPRALIEDIRARANAERPPQADLFSDFNGVEEAVKTDFYQHEQHWSNRMILGDSLLVMASLAEKERLRGRVQMVYLDPPYGIKFGSNWQVSTRKRDVKDGKKEEVSNEREVIKAFRDTWELGINSYLKVWRDRLTVARDLLNDSGSIFVQIGDENVHLVRCLLDELFGRENFRALLSIKKTSGLSKGLLPTTQDFIIWYSKTASFKYKQLFVDKQERAEQDTHYTRDADNRMVRLSDLTGPFNNVASCLYDFDFQGKSYRQSVGRQWKTTQEGMTRLAAANRLVASRNMIYYKRYLDDFPLSMVDDTWHDISGSIQSRSDPKIYVVQTSTAVIARCMLMTTDPGDLVLDPTCGSGTTAYVAEQWGRRWITIDTSRVALALARTRLMTAKFPYYLLADSLEGQRKESELTGKPVGTAIPKHDIRQGFVYKRVPHVTLKSIANNPDIREGMTREQIDRAIAKHAETETLYDQPYTDTDVVRVAGPFTVESLSPHRVLPQAEDAPPPAAPSAEAIPAAGATDFVRTILDNMRVAGVQTTRKKERLKLLEVEPYPGRFIQARATYEEDGQRKLAGICIGPEFGTVGPGLMRDAAREAHKGIGFDLLLMCGFAFDPLVYEDGKDAEEKMGRCKVWFVRMNQDLTMGDELKKTATANLFMVFGEPDIDIRAQPDGKLVVEVRGLDVFDPTTGAIRSGGTDDLACWFLDTAYDGFSFFVRHAYFCGGNEPYEKLQKALRAEIDEAEWAKLYTTTSRPFDPPKSGTIAVKVINHYGDEVLKVYPVPTKAATGKGK